MVVRAAVHCGIDKLGWEMARALEREGLVICAYPDWHLVVDAPWGWAISGQVPVTLEGAVIVTDNPCPEYRLDLLDERPVELLSKVSMSDIAHVLNTLGDTRVPSPVYSPLTLTERAVLRLAAKGHTNKSIAKCRGIGEQRVKNLLSSIYQKLALRSQVQLAHYYYGNWHILEGWELSRHSRD
jgi:DNA-binding CsgD family transcriptional regulator